MQSVDKEQNKTARERLLERVASKFPDRNFAVNDDGTAQNAQELEEAIWEMLTEADKTIADNNSKNEQLVKLFADDPASADFITRWVELGDPRAALVETFGDELSELATEEGRSKFSENLKSWKEKAEKSSALDKEAEENWQNTLNALNEWGDEKGLSDEQKVQVILRLIKIVESGLVNRYEVDDFDMVLKEMNYSNDLENARKEGEVSGRNAKIKESRRNPIQDLPPNGNTGQGMHVPEQKPNKEFDPWADLK